MADYLHGEYPHIQPVQEERLSLEVWEPDDTSPDSPIRHHNSPNMRFSPFDESEDEEDVAEQRDSQSYPDNEELLYSVAHDPIRLRGVGGTTLFGLNNHFDDEFPSCLVGKVAPEEYIATIAHINAVLYKSISLNLKFLFCGCLCCCCTLGLSLGPVLYLTKRTQSRIEKFIAQENWRLYNGLGLNIRLKKEQCEGHNLKEYVILIEFLPKLSLYRPD